MDIEKIITEKITELLDADPQIMDHCHLCKCPAFTRDVSCPCQCHESYEELLKQYGGNEKLVKERLDELDKLLKTDPDVLRTYKQHRAQRIFDEIDKRSRI